MTRIAYIDTETSGVDDEPSSVIELAMVELESDSSQSRWRRSFSGSALYGPANGAVSARASAVHHLTADMLAEYPPFDRQAWEDFIADVDYIAAHNAAFDMGYVRAVLPADAITPPVLCTMKLARHAWPDAPSHGLQALRYHLGLTGDLSGQTHPHRAGYDAVVGSWLLIKLLEHYEDGLEEMVRISSEPSLLPRINFGKHRGQRWADAPRDYLEWVLRQDFDEDVRHTARYHLGRK